MNSIFDTKHLYRNYFKMAVPVMLGLVVTIIYNLADTFFIAQTGNTNLIAGVSLCSPVFTALMAIGNIYGQGCSSLISRLLGQNDAESIKRVSSFGFNIALITGVVLAIIMTAFNNPILYILGADTDTRSYAFQYYIVLSICAPIIVLSFIHSNLIRCEGMANESMFGTIMGALINIVLDPILISVIGLGAMGAAISTVIGYFCSVVYFLLVLQKKSIYLSVKITHCHITRIELGQILGVGITAALSNLMQSLCIIVINHYLLSYGNDKIAAMGIVLKINMIAGLILTGFAFGGVPLFGYLHGSKQFKELKKLITFCLLFLSGLSLVLTFFLCTFASPLMNVFVKEPLLIVTGAQMLRWQAVTTIFAGAVLLFTVLFQATGKIIPSFIMSISRQGIVFVIVLQLCANLFAYNGILMAQALSDIISCIIAIILLMIYNPMRVK